MGSLVTRTAPELDTRSHDFTVSTSDETQTVTGHHAAVSLAKDLSRGGSSRVTVERDDGVVSMQFNEGCLDSYVWDTHKHH